MKHEASRHRRSIRLRGYDYSRPGAYFITICTYNRACLFGEIADDEMVLNEAGRIAEKCWHEIPSHFPHVRLDTFIIMPNHIHAIVILAEQPVDGTDVGAKNFSPLRPHATAVRRSSGTSQTIGSIVRGFKIGVTKWMRQHTDVYNVWQRNYWEHIVRDEQELHRMRRYIIDNPAKWATDRENPVAINTNNRASL